MSEKMNININERDAQGRTLLHIAAETGDAEICEVAASACSSCVT